jgi:Lrp/AsnC family leucine-responsive transcriptional regulator
MLSFDRIDLLILGVLQHNGRVSQHELARAAGLSAPAVAERVRKLEERGAIRGYRALLDPAALGQGVTAFVEVTVRGSRHFDELRARIAKIPAIVECHSITGGASHLLKVMVPDMSALEDLLAGIQGWPGVERTMTSLVLSTLKDSAGVPLPDPADAESDYHDLPVPADLLLVPFRHHL